MKKFIASIFSGGKFVRQEEKTQDIETIVKYQWICNKCISIIESGTIRYTNLNASSSYDLCESCFRKIIKSNRTNETLFKSFIEFENFPCFGTLKRKNIGNEESILDFEWLSYKQVFHRICCLSMGLEYFITKTLQNEKLNETSDIDNRIYLSICGKNCLDWYLSDYACFFRSFVNAPIHFNQTDKEMLQILELTKSRAVICTFDLVEKFKEITKNVKSVKYIFVMETNDFETPYIEDDITRLDNINDDLNDISIIPLNLVMKKGRNIIMEYFNKKKNDITIMDYVKERKTILNNITINRDDKEYFLRILQKETDLTTLVFTSGSSGTPKGVIIPDISLNRDLQGFTREYPKIIFSFSPLAHMSDRKHTLLSLCNGARAAIFEREMEFIFEDIQKVKPTIFVSTPRLYLVLYDEFKKALTLERIKAKLIKEDDTDNNEEDNEVKEKEIRKKVLLDFKNSFGGRVQTIIIGGASSGVSVRKFLQECFQCVVSDGYGMSECGGIMNDGRLHNEVKYKLIDVPEMNYFTTDKPYPRGELCVKTKTMFGGYFKNEELTKEALDEEGWLHTNDIVEELGKDTIKIIDRKKHIFKLSQGEFISPEKIENALIDSPYISQIFVYGSVKRSYLVAVIIPNEVNLLQFAYENGIINETSTLKEEEKFKITKEKQIILKENIQIQKKLKEEMEFIALKHQLLPYEVPKSFLLDFEPFTEENGRLTGSMKVKRFGCENHYKEQLELLYGDVDDNDTEESKEITKENISSLLNQIMFSGNNGDKIVVDKLNVIDSLQAVKFAGLIKRKYKVDIPISLLYSQNNSSYEFITNQVTNYINQQQQSITSSLNNSNVNWKEEILLPKDILQDITTIMSYCKEQTVVNNNYNKRKSILLTGATGFLGCFLLKELLKDILSSTDFKVYCIVRTNSTEEEDELVNNEKAFEKLKNKMIESKCWKEEYKNYIIALKGDLSSKNLGLSDKQIDLLTDEISMIYHNGANVNSVLSYHHLKLNNVESTKELIRFICKSYKKQQNNNELIQFIPIHYISTIGVVQSGLDKYQFPILSSEKRSIEDNINLLKEHVDNVLNQLEINLLHNNGYNSSKFIAEQLIQQIRLLGLPGTIFRPGMIGSDLESGCCNMSDWINRLINGCFVMNSYPITNRNINLVPVNIVANIIVKLSQQEFILREVKDEMIYNNIYEIINSPKCDISFDYLLTKMKQINLEKDNKEMKQLDYKDWKKQLKEFSENEELQTSLWPLLTLFKSDYHFPASASESMDTTVIDNFVKKLDGALKKSDVKYNFPITFDDIFYDEWYSFLKQ
ncbi:hypothetical protein ABK040_004667 [Willaertia magna]